MHARRTAGRSGHWLLAGLVALALSASGAWAAVPWMINYQGRLTDTSGSAITGTYTMTFRFYDAATSGSELWEEEQTVTLSESDNGIFNVVLGAVIAMSSVDFNTPMWLSVQVSDDAEMTPRQRLTAAGYAVNADQVDGLDATKFVRTDIDSSSSGKLTLTKAGAAFLIKPSTAPSANTKMLELQTTAGSSTFSVDTEGDVTVAGNLSVTGVVSGSIATTGTTSTTWTVDSDNSGSEPASGAGLVIEGGSGTDASLLWDATNDELDLNQPLNAAGLLTAGTDVIVTSGMRVGTGSTPDNLTALADDSLFVEGNVEVDGTIYAAAVNVGGATIGDITAVGDVTSGAAFTASTGADGTSLYFEGSTSDSNEIALTSANPGSDITVTIPATTGTLITSGDTGTVTSTMILDATLAAADLASDSVESAEIAAGAVGTSEIATDGVDTAEIAADAVGSSEIAAGAVDASELAATAVTAGSYGSATAVGTFTVDADGRLTAAANATIAVGAANISDDVLDFAQFEDTLDLDAALTLNQTTNTWSQSFTGTTTTGLTYTATSLTSGTALDVNATNTHTADAAIQQVRFDLVNAQATAANADFAGLTVNFTNNPSIAGNTEVAMRIQHPVTANTTDNAVSALLLLENIDTAASGATKITDAIRVQAATDTYVTDALDVSDAEIDNAINVGANSIVGTTPAISFSNFAVGSTGAIATGSSGGSQAGSLVFYDDDASGPESITLNAAAGTDLSSSAVLTLPTTTGTFAVSASSPLSLNATSGVISCPTCSTSSGTAPIDAEYLVSTANGTLTAEDVFTDGLALDSTNAAGTFTVAFDPTELLGSRTWGDASTDTIVWTWDRATGTDVTMTIASGAANFSGLQEAGSGVLSVADQHAGTDVTADLEEETHATEHSLGGTDAVTVTNLASACTDAQVLGGTSGGTGVECQSDDDTAETDAKVANDITIATTVTNSASGSANPIDVTSALAAFNGSDNFTALDVNLTNANHTGASNTVYGLNIATISADAEASEYALNIGSGWDRALSITGTDIFTLGASDYAQIDGSTTANTTTAGILDLNGTSSTNNYRTLDVNTTATATTPIATAGIYNTLSSSAVVTGTLDSAGYGTYTTATKTGADTNSGTYDLYGSYATVSNTGSTNAGSKRTYGGYFAATGDTAGTATTYGVYATVSGADTNYAGIFEGGNVGIGDTTPDALLDIEGGDMRLGTGTFNNAGASEDLYITGNLEVDGTIYGTFSGNAATATALAANGANCSAGNYPLGVDASGASESCTADDDTAETDAKVADNITIASSAVDQSMTFGAGNELTLDAATTDSTGTAGILDLNLDTTASQAGLDIDAETITDGAVDTVSAIKITGTQTSTDDDVLYGINIANLAGTADAGNEYAIYQAGTAWDYGLYAEDSIFVGGNLAVGNGTPGVTQDGEDAYVEGTLEVDGNTTLGDYLAVGGAVNAAQPFRVVTTLDSSDTCVVGCIGVVSAPTINNPANPTLAIGVHSQVTTADAAFILATSEGIRVTSPVKGASSTITNNYGINVLAQTAGDSDYGVAIGAAETQTLWVSSNADNLTAAAGMAFGLSRDTNLYRSAANTLKTDTSLAVGANLTVGGGTAMSKILHGTCSQDPASIAGTATGTTSCTATGVTSSARIWLTGQTAPTQDVLIASAAPGTDVITITWQNVAGAARDEGAITVAWLAIIP